MTTLLTAAICVFGLMAYRLLPVSDLPNVDFPTIVVNASLPGATPETMASAVATVARTAAATIDSAIQVALTALKIALIAGVVAVAVLGSGGAMGAEPGAAWDAVEAAAVAALHALFLSAVVFRAFTWRSFWAVVMESARGSAVITIILAGSFMLNYAFTAEGVPQAMAQWVDSLQLTRVQFLLMVNVMFLVLGCFLDVSVLLLVFVPMLLPAAKLLGVDLVHFGVLVVLNMMIGLIHPPFGMLLFVTKALTGIPIGEMIKEGWLFLVMLLALLLAMTFFPQIVLWLPHTMGYRTA